MALIMFDVSATMLKRYSMALFMFNASTTISSIKHSLLAKHLTHTIETYVVANVEEYKRARKQHVGVQRKHTREGI